MARNLINTLSFLGLCVQVVVIFRLLLALVLIVNFEIVYWDCAGSAHNLSLEHNRYHSLTFVVFEERQCSDF